MRVPQTRPAPQGDPGSAAPLLLVLGRLFLVLGVAAVLVLLAALLAHPFHV